MLRDAGFSEVAAAVGRARPRRPGLLSATGAALGPSGQRRAAPDPPADAGGPAPQSKAAVPGTLSWPVPILVGSRLRGHSKIGGLTFAKEGAS